MKCNFKNSYILRDIETNEPTFRDECLLKNDGHLCNGEDDCILMQLYKIINDIGLNINYIKDNPR